MFSIPGYDVESPLGRGSQAQVYYGRAAATGVRVALKVLPVPTSEAAESARSEAALLAGLDHPSLIRLVEYLEVPGSAVLVMELADGGSLAGLLRRRNRLSAPEVVAAISPVAAALAHAHAEGIRHGDVSAANILFDRAGRAKLADLGVARLFGSDSDWIGTPAYLDPTVAAGGVPGAASDVFSLAAVALHALTGRGPWEPTPPDRTRATISRPDRPASTAELLATAAAGKVADLPIRLRDCPPELSAVVVRALAADPGRRGTAAELALDLRASVRSNAGVVLGGGRVAPRAGRHSPEHRDQAEPPAAAAPDRPAFERPRREGVPAVGHVSQVPADLTHIRRPIIRPALAEPGIGSSGRRSSRAAGDTARLAGRWRRARTQGPRPRSRAVRNWKAGGAVGLTVASAAGICLIALGAGHRPDRASAATVRVGPPTPVAVTPATSATTGPSEHVAWSTVLARLDALRSAAYAARDPARLAQVYRSAALLTADRSQLLRTVPAGCRLTGLRTGYSAITAKQVSTGWSVRATVTVGAAALHCGDDTTATPAAQPERLDMTLIGSGSNYRIGAERQVGGP